MRVTQEGWTTAATKRRIVVSIPDRKLVVLQDDQVLALFDVAVGAPSTPSPIGTFTIVNRIPNPTYYRPGKVIAPGANNPLGTRWLGLNQKGYGIHGTDSPARRSRKGAFACVTRMLSGSSSRCGRAMSWSYSENERRKSKSSSTRQA
jgi:lipoprotein-anchoring transpeptidase ErfK/SrfK